MIALFAVSFSPDKNYERLHRYLVDATPVTGDICSANCNAETAVWKTILVGGLGKGGRGYYALDITDPAAPKALWEFTHADLGYTYYVGPALEFFLFANSTEPKIPFHLH